MTQRTSWKRLVGEGLVILLSILAAFGIDTAWEVRQETAHLQTILGSLERGFEAHIRLIDRRVRSRAEDQRRLLAFINADADEVSRIDSDSTHFALQSIYRAGVDDVNITLLVATLENANLELLENLPLEEAVAVWRRDVERLGEEDGRLISVSQDGLRALSPHPDVRPGLAGPVESSTDPRRLVEVRRPTVYAADVMRRVRQDEEAMAAATVKAQVSRVHLRLLLRVQVSADSVMALLESASNK